MGHPRTPALYVSAAMLAIVVAVVLLLRSNEVRPSEPQPLAQAPGVADPGARLEELAPPAGRDLDWRAAVEAEPAAPGQPVRASGDPERAAHVFGFVHTPDAGLAKSVRVQWNAQPQYTLRVRLARPPGSTDPHAEPRNFDVVDGRFEGDVGEGLWIVGVVGQALTNDLQDYARLEAPVPQLRRLSAGSRTQIDLDFRPAGTCSVQGTILDEEGKPFGELHVQVSELHELVEPKTRERVSVPQDAGSAVSAAGDGSFAIPALPPGRFQIFVEPGGYKPIGGTIGEYAPPRELVLSDGPMTIELTVRRPHPVHVTGRVEVDPAWAAEHGLAGQIPKLEFVCLAGREGVLELRDPVGLAGQDFDLWFEASVREPRLEVKLGPEKIVQPLAIHTTRDPAPLTIRFPR